MSHPPTVLVTGASSQLGVFLLPRLAAEGMDVTALSRAAPSLSKQVSERMRWRRPQQDALAQAQFLVSCGPLGLASELVENNKVSRKAVVFSTTSVFTKPDSADAGERDTIAKISEQENRLKSACSGLGVGLVIIRPTLIYGCGMDRNVSLLLRFGEKTSFIPLSRNAGGLRQPVHADDLAELAVKALTNDTGPLLEGEACGGSTLPYREMASRVARCGTRKIRPLNLPAPLLAALVHTASLLGPGKNINPQMVNRQSQDMVFDDTPLKKTLSWRPREFHPTPKDFRIPNSAKHLQLSNKRK